MKYNLPRKFRRQHIEQAHSINLVDYYPNRQELFGINIDPAETIDRDDGIWLLKKENGNLELQISITDVTAFIPKNSPIDEEAIRRVSTLYHTSPTSPMLPIEISTNLGSLEENKKRLTLTLFIEINNQGEVQSSTIKETLFNNLKAFSYEEVEKILTKKSHKPEEKMLLEMQKLAKILSINRGGKSGILTDNGYLDEDGNLIKDNVNAHQLIAEFMILSNRLIAEKLHNNQCQALFRTQDVGIEDLKLAIKLKGHLLVPAEYSHISKPHVGLGLPYYCHFTSPLRRLPDLINHRIIKALINKSSSPYTTRELMLLASHINSFNEQNKLEREVYLRQKREREKEQKFKVINDIDFDSLSQSDLSLLIDYAVENNLVNEILPQIEKRINELQPKDFYRLWLIGKVNKFLDIDSIDAVSVFLIKSQIEGAFIEYKSHYCEFRKKFWFFCYVDGLTTIDPVEDEKKNQAKHKSAKAWIKAYLEDNLTTNPNPFPPFELEEVIKVDLPSNSPTNLEETDSETNWIAILNQYCQANRLPYPTYTFSQIDGYFCCKVTLELEDQILEAENYGLRKKSAKMKAAYALVSQYDLT
jgi:ribonuclease R